MNIERNQQRLEDLINNQRINNNTRILWPDFEIYDLLANGYTFSQIQRQTAFPPYITCLDMDDLVHDQALCSKQYTHIAIAKRTNISSTLEVTETVYAFLTKRNIAVDQLECKYVHGKYWIDVQIAQFDRNNYLWGAEVISGQEVIVISPKYICKRNTLWLMEYQLEQSARAFIFYSVKREPNYGKNYYGQYLPIDVVKEGCFMNRNCKSIMDYYFKKEEELVNPFDGHHQTLGSLNNIFNKEEKPYKREIRSTFKYKMAVHHQEKLQNNRKNTKLTNTCILENESVLYHEEHIDIGVELGEQVRQLKEIGDRSLQLIPQSLQSLSEKQPFKINLISDIQLGFNFDAKSVHQKLQFVEKAISLFLYEVETFALVNLLLYYHRQSEKDVRLLIRLYQLIKMSSNRSLCSISQRFLENILIVNCQQMLKDADDYLPKLNKLLGSALLKCIQESLSLNYTNEMSISDKLFIIMKLRDSKSIFHLYHQQSVISNNVTLGQSLGLWLYKNGLPSNQNIDLLYQLPQYNFNLFDCEIAPEIKQSVKDSIIEQFEVQKKKISFIIKYFQKRQLLATKSFLIDSNKFTVYLFRIDQFLYCMLEESAVINNLDTAHQSYQSYSVLIDLKINGKRYREYFRWNFTLPTHSVGRKIKVDEGQLQIECSLFMKRDILHQSIMNLLKIRSLQMFKMPEMVISEERNKANQRLLKRRSTFLLEEQCLGEDQNLKMGCFFHKQCGSCRYLLQQSSIYQLDPIDIFSILLGNSFRRQLVCLLAIMKYYLLTEHYQNWNFLSQTLRLDQLKLTQLLQMFKQHHLDCNCQQQLNKLISDKIENSAIIREVKNKRKQFLFKSRGRNFYNSVKYFEGDFSQDFLEYQFSMKL